jgi:hypothetical protein
MLSYFRVLLLPNEKGSDSSKEKEPARVAQGHARSLVVPQNRQDKMLILGKIVYPHLRAQAK